MTDPRASRVVAEECDAPTPRDKARRIRLETVNDVRVEMARVYREMRAGTLAMENGTKLVYVLAQLGRVAEVASVEQRLRDLEERMKPQGGAHALGFTHRSTGTPGTSGPEE